MFLTAISRCVSSSSWDHLHLRKGGGAHHVHLGGQRAAQHPSGPAGRGLQHSAEGRHLGASGEHPWARRLSAAAHSEYCSHTASRWHRAALRWRKVTKSRKCLPFSHLFAGVNTLVNHTRGSDMFVRKFKWHGIAVVCFRVRSMIKPPQWLSWPQLTIS